MYKHAVFLCILCYFIVQDAGAEDLEFVILHNNDMHARFEEYDNPYSNQKVGGMGRTAYVIKQARKAAESGEGPPVLYLNGGDTFTGTVWYAVHKWKIVADFMNLLKPDAASLGNHEFDQGIEGLMPYIDAATFPIVCANINLMYEKRLKNNKLHKSIIVTIKGWKIGIMGYLTQSTKLVASVGKVIFRDEVRYLRMESRKLRNDGATIIIALGHSGHETDKLIAEKVALVDIVVGAHSHYLLWNGPKPDKEEPVGDYPTIIKKRGGKLVPVVTAYANAKYMGQLKVRFDEQGDLLSFTGHPIFLNESVPQDPEALELLSKYKARLDSLDDAIGRTTVYLHGDEPEEPCRYGECNFGNLILDAFVDAVASLYKGKFRTDTPVAIMNAGAIGIPGIEVGNITVSHILETMPYDQRIFTCRIKGRYIVEALEHGMRSNGETHRGEFLQVSGLRVVFDPTKPTRRRVINVQVMCTLCSEKIYYSLVRSRLYRIAVTEFVLNGGDGYTVIKNNCKYKKTTSFTDSSALERYIRLKRVVSPEIDGRLTAKMPLTLRSDANVFKINLICITLTSLYLISVYFETNLFALY